MNCPKCGQSVPNDARFCGKCGQQVDSGAAPAGDFGLGTPSVASAGAGAGAGMQSGGGVGSGPSPFPGAHALPGLLERVKNILLTPKTEWPVIRSEATSVGQLYTGYVMPMAAFAAVMSFIRMSVIGVNLPFGGTIRTPITSGLVSSVVTFVLGLIGLYLVGFIINMLAPTFAGQRDQRQALQTAAYAMTPAWLGTALSFLPFGPLLQLLAGIYGIYVLYLGLPVMMRANQEKAGGYTAAVVVCCILVGILFAVVGATLGGVGRMGAFGITGASSSIYESHSPEARAAAAERAGAVLGNAIGGVLGTDQKGKDGLANALSNLAKAGQQMEQDEARANAAARSGAAGSAIGADGSPDSARAAMQGASGADAGANAAAALGAAGSNSTGASGSAQNPMAAAGALVSALGGALGGDVHHEPVDFNTLKGMLPTSLPQMQRTDAQGSSQQALGVKSSSATAEYRGTTEGSGSGSANPYVRIKIADMSGVSGLLDAASGLVPTGETQTDTGFEKDMVVNGRMIHEKYDRRSGDGEVSAIVAKRFSVEVTGRGVDIAQLEKTLSSVDLARLESMKDAGAQAR